METWSGFTDEDLKRIKERKAPPQSKGNKGKHTTRKSSPQQLQEVAQVKEPRVLQSAVVNEKFDGKIESNVKPIATTDDDKKVVEMVPKQELPENAGVEREISQMERFRLQQKIMEEQNKQKRALLAQAITARRQRAKSEANRLTQVQEQLNALDQMLTTDISIIRNRIEEASVEYLDAQRRYHKAEVEYVAAKIELHKKSEIKEQLTEHLYNIIHQNERRKAQKLAELMEKLALEAEADDEPPAVLPPLNLPSTGVNARSVKTDPVPEETSDAEQPPLQENITKEQSAPLPASPAAQSEPLNTAASGHVPADVTTGS